METTTDAAKPGGDSNGSRVNHVDKWWAALSRLVAVQLCCSLLMQLSYVAFPAYNFALALWCLVCCTPKWVTKNPRLLPLHVLAMSVSIVTDVIWMSLWVSGRVFYDQFCGQNGVSIVSCGGATDYYPGCETNRFALFTLILNDLAKAASAIAMYRIHVLPKRQDTDYHNQNHHHHHHHHRHRAPAAQNNSRASSEVQQMPTEACTPPRSEA